MTGMIESIGQNCHIPMYQSEAIASYKYRVAYSVLGKWIRNLCCNYNNSEETKASITRKSSLVLKTLCKTDSSLCEVITNSDLNLPIFIRDTLFKSGDIYETGFPSKIHVLINDCFYHSKAVSIYRGFLNNNLDSSISGLCTFCKTEVPIKNNLLSIFDINNSDPQSMFKLLMKRKYSTIDNLDGFEFFDPFSNKVFSSSWRDTPIYGREGITVIREKNHFGYYTYMILRAHHNKIYVSEFTEFEQRKDVQEPLRALYCLRSVNGNPSTTVFFQENTYTVWRFWSQLPPNANQFLSYIGWPMDPILNKRNTYLVRNELTPLILEMLNVLGIEREQSNGKI